MLIIIGLSAGLYLWVRHSAVLVGWGSLPFDSGRWKAVDPRDWDSVRGKMVRSLVRDHRLKGMTRSQVIQLLGHPDGSSRATKFIYILGAYSGFGIDYDVLELEFDAAGRARKWRIYQT